MRLTVHGSISPKYTQWLPSIDWVWGEATHFIHEDGDYTGEGKPLNKQYSVDIMWLWCYFTICYEAFNEVFD